MFDARSTASDLVPSEKTLRVLVNYDDPYVQPLILAAIANVLGSSLHQTISSLDQLPSPNTPLLQWSSYENIVFEHGLAQPTTSLANAYVIRKALIRKHYLATTARNWITKHPDSLLQRHVKPAVDFEVDYAEFLDEALLEAFELHEAFARNADKMPEEREWWILKPGMSDGGQGIRIFSTKDELTAIFEEWEAAQPDSSDEGSEEGQPGASKDQIITSQLRHFVAQPYIHLPLLFAPGHHKFHIRTYALAAGSLRVHVYQEMLALFAATPYTPPGDNGDKDMTGHLTNTCLQSGAHQGNVRRFWDLPSTPSSRHSLPADWKAQVFEQICTITGETFKAAAKGMMIHFQTLPNAFEIFGLDFLADERGTAWLLEVNAFPDFKQTGQGRKDIIAGLFEQVVEVAVNPFFGFDGGERALPDDAQMRMVLDIDMGRR